MRIIIDILTVDDSKVLDAFQNLIDPETIITKEKVAEMVASYIDTVVLKFKQKQASNLVRDTAVPIVDKVVV